MMRWPASLAGRLVLAFVVVAAVTLTAAGAYLYYALNAQLRAADDAMLLGKIAQLRHLSSETPSADDLARNTHRYTDVVSGHDGLILRVATPAGRTLIEVNPEGEVVTMPPLIQAETSPAESAVHTWTSMSGIASRAVAAEAWLGQSGSKIIVLVAQDGDSRAALLANYQRHIVFAVVGGVAAVALLSLLLVRSTLRGLARIGRQAAAVVPSQLDTRLTLEGAPRELADLLASLNAMLTRLQDGFARLSQFSADLAHDFRTPLANLVGQTEVTLAHPRTVEEYRSVLESNLEEYARLSHMIEDMLFLARADHARVALSVAPLDARHEIQVLVDYFEAVAADREIAIRVTGDAQVRADATLLRRAINNLLDNALRYTPTGERIDVVVEHLPHEIGIVVRNPGPTIPAESLPLLFERFYRGDPSRAQSGAQSGEPSSQSTGLGLAIVKTIMDLHGGTVQASSPPGGRTEFRLVFPA
ncbi:heavy metal sensor histidine kinase [Ralstonia insidiosa]|uniref:heavy metal sensor histidine kinase n=1 Tax=Ralstonia TaxID=48736 RepID=UPI000664AE7E|nr:heavy metal sensor histidine kinase [Ralstonia insidiosa]KMW49301.1 cytochrome C1 [Ralstonia sp. MD27]MBX3775048.1 heavy metal sensor histidine kinase [Ralstonia pickettii]NOZ18117.1 heavy metal sensor histidine kinase [Betaproteobacteria bacterium]MBA9859137.1 HAMP domain-containing protein [Ralstonia insidiosa]MBA9872509.1 HAMP domain-containing protein [Ralstonia insidiosa]